jgi:hypothetical protein
VVVRLQVRRLPGLCYIEQGRCRLLSRNGNILSRFEALDVELAAVLLGIDDAIIDGKVIAPDETGRPQFSSDATRTPVYVAFDILWRLVPTSALCRSASAESGCKRFYRRSHRSSPSRYPSPAEVANSSN